MKGQTLASTPTGRWALWDTQDNLWIGNDTGPLRYDDEILGRLAAEVASGILGWEPVRITVKEYDGSATKIRDDVPIIHTVQEVLHHVTQGYLFDPEVQLRRKQRLTTQRAIAQGRAIPFVAVRRRQRPR